MHVYTVARTGGNHLIMGHRKVLRRIENYASAEGRARIAETLHKREYDIQVQYIKQHMTSKKIVIRHFQKNINH